jgi:hypothetical protein
VRLRTRHNLKEPSRPWYSFEFVVAVVIEFVSQSCLLAGLVLGTFEPKIRCRRPVRIVGSFAPKDRASRPISLTDVDTERVIEPVHPSRTAPMLRPT